MSCQSLREAIVDVARGVSVGPGTAAAVESHVTHCPSCAARLERERELSEGLRAMSAATDAATSPAVEAQLLQSFHALHGKKSATGGRSDWWRVAAALILIAGGVAWWRSESPAPVAPPARQTGLPTNTIVSDGFVPLPVAAGLPDFESGAIVRVEIPVASLPSYGIEMVPDARRTQVQADLLVGQDGQARAIRLVSSARADRVTP